MLAYAAPIIDNGYAYVQRFGYTANAFNFCSGRRMTCVELTTGKTLWDHFIYLLPGTPDRESFVSQSILADGKIYLRGQNGTLVMIAADPKEYRELGHYVICNETPSLRCSMALSQGQIFWASSKGLICLDMRAH